jgi:hypothetical protein
LGVCFFRSLGVGHFPEMLADFFGCSQIDGAGVRFLFRYASFWKVINDRFGFDLKVTSQFIDSNLIRVCHHPRDLFFLVRFVRSAFVDFARIRGGSCIRLVKTSGYG